MTTPQNGQTHSNNSLAVASSKALKFCLAKKANRVFLQVDNKHKFPKNGSCQRENRGWNEDLLFCQLKLWPSESSVLATQT